MDNSIYEVTREDYKGFVNQIKPECRDVKIEKIGTTHVAAKVFSKKTGEKYYIFEMPDWDERCEPVPVRKLVLETKEEVQAFFDAIAKLQKEKQND